MKRKRTRCRGTRILSCDGRKIVRFCLTVAAALVMCSCATKARELQRETAEPSIETGFDGCFFSTENVIDTIAVSETAHYVLYDDIDAGLDDEMIRLTPKAYRTVCQAIAKHQHFTGKLKAVCPYETVEYVVDEWERMPLTMDEYAPLACADIIVEDEEVPL